MKIKLLSAVLLLAWSSIAFGQSVSGSIPSAGGGATCVVVNSDGQGIVGISVTGTWTGTLQPQVAIGGDAAQSVQVTPYNSTTAQNTITANGAFTAAVVGSTQFQLCGNTVASGTANVKLNVVKLAANRNAGGGSGSGTVSANNGSAGAIANYAAAGGSTTVGPDSLLTDNGSNLSYTGTQGFKGPTGTVTNPTYGWNVATGYGLFFGNGTIIAQGLGLVAAFSSAGNNGERIAQSLSLQWVNSSNPDTGTVDVGIGHPNAGGVLTVDTTADGNELGLFRAGIGPCRVTADITLPVNTATNVCSWSLPAVAKAWSWQCSLIWTITVGTGTNTMSVGVNASQTPTGTTNVAATIDATTATLTGSQAAVPLSASGAVNVLTGGTYTPAATLEQAQASGTLLASATAGTFAITMTAAGTTATAAAKAGSTCYLY